MILALRNYIDENRSRSARPLSTSPSRGKVMQSFSARFKRAEASVKSAFSRADAEILSLPDVTINPHRGLGALIVSAAANSAFNPSAESHRIGKRLNDDVNAALSQLNAAQADGEALEAVSAYLKGVRPLPDDIDAALASHAKQVKASSAAGLIDAQAVAADIDRYISETMLELKRLKGTFVASTESAAKIVAAKATAAAYRRAGLTKAATVAELRVARLKGVHFHRFAGNMPQAKSPRLPARIRRASV
jgi:hypothetical protein